MRYHNKQIVLNLIRNKDLTSRAELSRLTGLSMPAIMKIVDFFIEVGVVEEMGTGVSTGGKPPKMLKFVENAYYSVGVDLGATNIICVLMNAHRVLKKLSVPTCFQQGPDEVIARIVDTIHKLVESSGIDWKKIIGVGIAVPGIIDVSEGQVLFSPDIKWYNVDLISILQEKLHVRVYMDNATRATAFGEKLYGEAKETEDYMCINLGYGIGGAIVFHNEVYQGNGAAGEFGHMMVSPDGPQCDCGNYGCLEAVSSARAMVRDAKAGLETGTESMLRTAMENGEELSAKLIYNMASRGDDFSEKIVLDALRYLGAAIASVINLLDIGLIILEGGISRNGAYFTENLFAAVEKHRMPNVGQNTRIVVSKLGDVATAIGAASIVMNHLLESGGDVKLMMKMK